MEIIKRFNFNNNELSVYGTPVKPWFKAKDVVMMLGYSHTKDAIKTNVDLEDVNTYSELRGRLTDPLVEMHPDTKFINESGLYALIFGSKKAEAKKFKRWITNEVLPTIRRTGSYELHYKQPLPMISYKIETEKDLQMKTINFIRQTHNYKQLLFTGTFGEDQKTSDDRLEKYKLGYTAGIPDFILFNPSKSHAGLIIEFKSPTGRGELSEKQKQVIQQFKKLNFKTIVSNNYDEIIIKLTDYIREIRIQCDYCKNKFKSEQSLKSHHIHFHRILVDK